MVQINEVKGNTRENRTAAHTHIKGLGLRSDGYAETSGAGFVGQVAAREVRRNCGAEPTSWLEGTDLALARHAVLSWTSLGQRRCQGAQYC